MSAAEKFNLIARDFTLDSRPTLIFHIFGGICAGKSWLIRQIREEYLSVAYWDVQKFYEARGCIFRGQLDWKLWRKVQDDMLRELRIKLRENAWADIFLIESSGTNELLNALLKKAFNVVNIGLQSPQRDVLKVRAKSKELSLPEILDFNKKVSEKAKLQFDSQEHALSVIRRHIAVCKEIRKRA